MTTKKENSEIAFLYFLKAITELKDLKGIFLGGRRQDILITKITKGYRLMSIMPNISNMHFYVYYVIV